MRKAVRDGSLFVSDVEDQQRPMTLGDTIQVMVSDRQGVWLDAIVLLVASEGYPRAIAVALPAGEKQTICITQDEDGTLRDLCCQARLRAWHKTKRGPKPHCRIDCLPAELKKHIRTRLRELIPDLHERPMELAFNILMNQMLRMKPSAGAFPRWMRILADEEGMPSSTKQHTIPFSKANSLIIPPASERDTFSIKLRIDRIPVEGRKLALSTEDEITLQTKKRGISSRAATLKKIADGVYEHAGSNLHYHAATREWYVSVCYKVPESAKANVDPEKMAFLRPATKRPYWLRMDSYNHWMGGRTGRHVAYVRQQLLTQRWGKQEAYTHASHGRKGHGRGRAIGKIYLLRNRWQDFVKTANQSLAKNVIDKMVEAGYGTLVYFQPASFAAERTFLYMAGKLDGRPDPSGWDFSGLAAILGQQCHDRGIKLVIHRVGDTRVESYANDGALVS